MRDNKTSSRVFGTLARCLLAFTVVLALHVLCLGLGLWGRLGRGCASSPGVDAPMS